MTPAEAAAHLQAMLTDAVGRSREHQGRATAYHQQIDRAQYAFDATEAINRVYAAHREAQFYADRAAALSLAIELLQREDE